MKFKYLFALILLLFFSQLYGQNGNLRGTIYDEATGEYLPGVTVFAEGTSMGTITDLDGKFNLSLPSGTYDLRISFISYETLTLKGIQVKQGNVTVLEDMGLKEATIEITGVTVTGQRTRNTENALMSMKMKSANLLDGISAGNLRKIGDSDAAASIKRVSGVSVSNGKYVYVRGLGDRYTKTILNGVEIPGLDPDRNTIQMDIFPTSIIDNIIVYKTFSANLPADFTGGVIDIALKDFPERKVGNLSISAGYNPDFHLNDNYLTYKGGSTDYLGFDDGTRNIPATSNIPSFGTVVSDSEGDEALRYQQILSSFDPTMAAMREKSFIDYSVGITLGNQRPLKKFSIGYNLALSYKTSTEYYSEMENGRYRLEESETEMVVSEHQTGSLGVDNRLVTGLLGFALKTKSSKYGITFVHLQNGESKAGIYNFIGRDEGSNFESYQHILDYSQRSLSNLLIDGKHIFSANNWEVEWKISPTISKLEDPDVRFTRYEIRDGSYSLGTEVGFPERIWRELDEVNLAGILHASKQFNLLNRKSKLSFGGGYTFKERNYQIRKFSVNIRQMEVTGNPDELFLKENLWDGSSIHMTNVEPDFIPNHRNKFNSEVQNIAGFLTLEMDISQKIRAIAGTRVESYLQLYTGENQLGTKKLSNEKVQEKLELFPTINLVYKVWENQNIRVSYAKTTARPSFKEVSYAEIYDPLSGTTFIGGLHIDGKNLQDSNPGNDTILWDGKLTSTAIMNFDLRWEVFLAEGQMFSLGAFFKTFDKPIELVQYVTQTGAFQPRNVGGGQLYGAEAEFRINFGWVAESLKPFAFSSNITFVESRIKYTQLEYETRVRFAKKGETIKNYRDMAGQSPYILNLGLVYDGGKDGVWKGLEAGLFYNVQGKTLYLVGITDRPDVYNNPFHSLNLNINKKFGEEQKLQVGIKIDNILNQDKETVYSSYGAADQYYEMLSPGTTYTMRLSYNLF